MNKKQYYADKTNLRLKNAKFGALGLFLPALWATKMMGKLNKPEAYDVFLDNAIKLRQQLDRELKSEGASKSRRNK